MRANRLRELLDEDRPSLGTHLHSTWPGITELVGHSGAFDYVEYLTVYSPWDLRDLEHLARAVELFPHMTSLIKIDQEPRTFLATRSLGSGIQNLLFADVRTADDARECVAAVRPESPASGNRNGVGMRRDVGYVVEPAGVAYEQALQRAVVGIMIEKVEAVENLEAILAVDGIDMVNFGRGDYALSAGLTGQFDHPQVREAEEHVIRTAQRMGVVPRVEITVPSEAERWLELGVKHFSMGADVLVLYHWWKAEGARMLELLGRAPAASA